MAHARKQIRDAVAAALAPTPSTGTWSHVHPSRIDLARQIDYLKVFADSDAADVQGIDEPILYDRTVSLVSVGMLRLPGTGDTVTIEDKMDALAEEVETKLTNAVIRALLPGIGWIALDTTRMDVVVTEEIKPDHAEVTLAWNASYATEEGAPDVFV